MSKLVKPLTQMQYKFCSNYIKNGFNVKQAAIDAGYSEHYARTKANYLIDLPAIRTRVETAYKQAQDRLGLDWQWKLKKLERVINEFIPNEGSLNSRKARVGLQALAELNKMQGDYAPDKRISMTVDATQGRLLEARKQYKDY